MGKYKVEGTRPVFGHEPGETFEKDLTEEQEARYVARGSISLAGAQSSTPVETDAGDASEDNDDSGDAGERSWS